MSAAEEPGSPAGRAGRLAACGLTPTEIEAIGVVAAADPALVAELESIADSFEEATRARFWRAFARLAPGRDRPADCVATALEEAILGR